MYTSFCLNLVHRSGRSARHLLFDIRRLVGSPKERKNRLLGLYRTSGGVIPDTIPHGQGLILLFKVDASDVAERPLNERENQTGCFFSRETSSPELLFEEGQTVPRSLDKPHTPRLAVHRDVVTVLSRGRSYDRQEELPLGRKGDRKEDAVAFPEQFIARCAVCKLTGGISNGH